MTSAAIKVVMEAWSLASMRSLSDASVADVESIPSTLNQLQTLARSQPMCFGCRRRKKIGLVVCWRCWDTGRPEKITNGVGASVYETEEEEEYREAMEYFYATPVSQLRLVFPEWLGLHDEDYIPSGPGTFISGKRRKFENRKLINKEEIENPEYQPLGSATASVLLSGAPSNKLINGVRYMHSNIYRRQQREGIPLEDVRLETKARSPTSLQISASLWSKSKPSISDPKPINPLHKSLPLTLHEQKEPMFLLHSSDRAASKRALLRSLQIVVALASRSHIFVRNCPRVIRTEAIMKRSLARMRNQMLFRCFSMFISNVFEQQRSRRLALEANKRCMRLFRKAQARCFDAWHTLASRNAKGRKILRKRLGGVKLFLYTRWKSKWAEKVRAKECEAKAKAFITRYKYQCAFKCLIALRDNAVGQIKLRKYMKRWVNMKLVKALKNWRLLVERNQRVRDFIRRQLQGMRDFCFETWSDNVREELESRKVKLQAAMYKMRNRMVVVGFNAIVTYWHLGLACREIQRVFRGYVKRVWSSNFKEKTIQEEIQRHKAEELEISQLVETVTHFQTKVWSADAVETARMASTSVNHLTHNNKEEKLFRANAHRVPTAIKKREKFIAALIEKGVEHGGAGAILYQDDVEAIFDTFDCTKTGVVAISVLDELLWTLLRRPPTPVMIESATAELKDPFTSTNFCDWLFLQTKQDIQSHGACHIGTVRNRKFLQHIELREIGRGSRIYAIERAKILGRYLYRFKEDAAPRLVCKKCRHGFRFPSQLKIHKQAKTCHTALDPYSLTGTISFQEAKELVESAIFPKLDTECTSRPQLNTTEFRYFKPELTFNGKEKHCHIRIKLDSLEHVRRGDARIGDQRPVLLVTEHVKVIKRSRVGLQKIHEKRYHPLVLKDEDAYTLWKNQLKRLCGRNKKLRRLRQEKRNRDREARRTKRTRDLAARSEARRKQFAEESREKATARRLAETKERDVKKRARRLAKAEAKLSITKKHNELVEAKKSIGNHHLVAQAHAFIAGTDEASEALALAELGLLPSSDEEEEWNMEDEMKDVEDMEDMENTKKEDMDD